MGFEGFQPEPMPEHPYDIHAGEAQFGKRGQKGRMDEYHGISHDGTSQGIFESEHKYSHTVWQDGEVKYHRDRYGNEVIDTGE